ncbi:MAG TPA: flagellar basal body rod protein FlgB [Bacteroidota bacterium]|nr:flagellar basal body rod protein FlgB [Candidatus Kapabacteria bacterium]HRS02201.1 flagellar basal body rod protein FlgB [Bacteroidota bacterium]
MQKEFNISQMQYNDYLFNTKLPLMNRALDAYALRMKTIAKNIANLDSPQYRPEKVAFEEYFQEAEVALSGARSDKRHIPLGKTQEVNVEGQAVQQDIPRPQIFFSGETHTDIDREMSSLAETQIRFRFASQMVSKYFKGLNQAITGVQSQ